MLAQRSPQLVASARHFVAEDAPMTLGRRLLVIFAVLVCCVGCDQATKAIAKAHIPAQPPWSYLGDTVRLQLAHNTGAFLSLGASLPDKWRQGLLSAGVACVLLALLAYALIAKSMRPRVLLGLALVIAGGFSNLIDRLVYGGYVVDFMNLGIGWLRTGIFNVADIAITTGVMLLVLTRSEPPATPANGSPQTQARK
jgi:signal peptidase II